MKRWLIVLFLVVPMLAVMAQKDSVKVLWVGNSATYYNDMPSMVKTMAISEGIIISNTKILKGGERLSGHLKNQKLLDLLMQGGWDYVILQEQTSSPSLSTLSVSENVYPYAKQLVDKIRFASPNAKIIFYQTWGHKDGNTYKEDIPYPLNDTFETMQSRLNTSYIEMAWMNKAWCAPVGMAWQNIRKNNPDYELYVSDGLHPSVLGSYLAANVIFTVILQKKYQSNYIPKGITINQAKNIQEQAQSIVLNNMKLLGIN